MGTLVFVPTHLSNLDSVVFGFALERAGLAAGDLRRGQEPLHEPGPLASSCTTSARTASTGASSTASTRTCSRPTRACSSSAATTRSSSRAARDRAPAASSAGSSSGLAGTGVEAFGAHGGARRAAARLLRAGDHQLPPHARGRDAHRRLPPGGGQGALHHRGRRVVAPGARRGVHPASSSASTPACVIRFAQARSTASATRSTRTGRRATRAGARSIAVTYVTDADGASGTIRRATRSTRASSARPSSTPTGATPW